MPDLRWLIACALSCHLGFAAESVTELPPAADIASAERTIRQLYKDEYKATGPKERQALIDTLRKQADDPANNAASRIALQAEAARAAGRAKRCEDALALILEIGRQYRGAGAYQANLLEDLAIQFPGIEDQERLAHAALDLAQEAMGTGRWSDARELTRRAEVTSRVSKSVVASRRYRDVQNEVVALERESASVEIARKTLAGDPANAGAKLQLGRWLCFYEDKWAEGLPMLAAGTNPEVAQIAQAELAATPKAAPGTAAPLAESWITLATKEAAARARLHLLDRALARLNEALAGAAGLDKVPVEKRLREVQAMRDELPAVASGSTKVEPTAGAMAHLLAQEEIFRITFTRGSLSAQFAQGSVPLSVARRGKGKVVDGLAGEGYQIQNDAFSLGIPERIAPALAGMTVSFGLKLEPEESNYGTLLEIADSGFSLFANHSTFSFHANAFMKIPLGRWCHIIEVFDYKARTERLYIDGQSRGEYQITVPAGGQVRPRKFILGTERTEPRFVTAFAVDEIVLYKRALSETEVKSLSVVLKLP